jgi:hypothetical protein
MAHEAVEIERRSDAGVDLVIRDFRLAAHGGGDLTRGLLSPSRCQRVLSRSAAMQ